MSIKLIATDLDGTLLSGSLSVSKANKRAMEKAFVAGITTVIATGRAETTIPDAVREIRGIQYLVTSNGAKILDFDSGELVYEKYINAASIELIWPIIEREGVMTEVFIDSTPYVDEVDYLKFADFGVPDDYLEYFKTSRKAVPDVKSYMKENLHRIENINFMFSDTSLRVDIYNELLELRNQSQGFDLTSSFYFNVEIGGTGVNKGDAIEYLAERLGYDRDEIMCIGDNYNDIDMIQYAGTGIAMGDAPSEVRQAADYIVADSDLDGVAEAIKQFAL
ncbi:MAG: Cof-type HAD-IIB family hydrolase [Clostridiales Family XIII bacterium]|jgi:Cof subfamily protein (haloacid dehalogenase superfamily)|nr:Cof-type HAD-IIB family hydrolase [Clostridiales Family XIII bacterium]